ncbi:MAG: FAD-dependent oxidoreductase [Actinomycetia bacterium]|nr:FAD-dependent oxidoreductase [Actinomycetes bacterium]
MANPLVQGKARFLGYAPCGESTGTFRFTRPTGYTFRAGQFFTLTLSTHEGVQTKHFSHANAPQDPGIELTTRLTGSAFKEALQALHPGEEVTISGPGGRLVLPDRSRPTAFLTGGVGITPARSIIRDLVLSGEPTKMALFYANRTEDSVPYAEEFRGLAQSREGFILVEVIEEPARGWSSETGRIDAALIHRHIERPEAFYWVVSGPPRMVDAMRTVVSGLRLAQGSVAFESFSGYGA